MRFLSLLFLAVLLTGCNFFSEICAEEPWHFSLEPTNQNAIRTDGYYYNPRIQSVNGDDTTYRLSLIQFFPNNVYLTAGATNQGSIALSDSLMISSSYDAGRYGVEGERLLTEEKTYPYDFFCNKEYQLQGKVAEIHHDSSFTFISAGAIHSKSDFESLKALDKAYGPYTYYFYPTPAIPDISVASFGWEDR